MINIRYFKMNIYHLLLYIHNRHCKLVFILTVILHAYIKKRLKVIVKTIACKVTIIKLKHLD